mmetsp:Transcript_2605/g.4938  ORF Transcript_2605/g.4938 Transcript_2605/m.4938 type:complete len:182 (+) Transcript_2605:2-547(+)
MRKLAIHSVDRESLSFVSDGTDGDGNKFEKQFTMTEGEQYVVYRKMGWDTMGCPKLLQQFLRDAELHQHSTMESPAAENVKATAGGSSSSSASATLEPGEEATVGDSTDDYSSGTEVFYSYAELSDPKVWKLKPEIVDRPHEREQFLAPDAFEAVFRMAREDFYKLPKWKQMRFKKDNQLW